MKSLFILLLFISFNAISQDLEVIRSQYSQAVNSDEVTSKMSETLSTVNLASSPVLLAYKGAVLTLKAKFAKSRSEKKDYFKKGVSLIESAVENDPTNIEIRYVRMSVQGNSPRFLGYHKNIEEDKKFILKNYASISSRGLKDVVRDFVMKTQNFDEMEKSDFEKN